MQAMLLPDIGIESISKTVSHGTPLFPLAFPTKLALISKRCQNTVVAGALWSLHQVGLPVFARATRRCPDGHKPHLSVCYRGWRGDVCRGCSGFRRCS